MGYRQKTDPEKQLCVLFYSFLFRFVRILYSRLDDDFLDKLIHEKKDKQKMGPKRESRDELLGRKIVVDHQEYQ